MEELGRAVEVIMKQHRQPDQVRKQYMKLIQNLADANEDESDIERMIEALLVKDEEEGE